MVLQPCLRRAYKEAKKIYKGLPPTALEPDKDKPEPLRVRIQHAVKQQGNLYEAPSGSASHDQQHGQTEKRR
jgi:hypothetical protein